MVACQWNCAVVSAYLIAYVPQEMQSRWWEVVDSGKGRHSRDHRLSGLRCMMTVGRWPCVSTSIPYPAHANIACIPAEICEFLYTTVSLMPQSLTAAK
jgi:hypothetical protein